MAKYERVENALPKISGLLAASEPRPEDTPHTPSPISTYDLLAVDWWLWEIVSLFVGIVSLAAVAFCLFYFDGAFLPEFPLSITLNALVAFLATISKACLLFTVSSCLSQLKWIGSRRAAQRMSYFQSFDSASRGVWGCMQLLTMRGAGITVYLAALTVIVALVFDPFTQQVLAYQQGNHTRFEEVNIPRATSFSMALAAAPPYMPDLSMFGAIYGGLAPDVLLSTSGITCPSGNCTWPAYESLGVCASVADVSEYASCPGDSDTAAHPCYLGDTKYPFHVSLVNFAPNYMDKGAFFNITTILTKTQFEIVSSAASDKIQRSLGLSQDLSSSPVWASSTSTDVHLSELVSIAFQDVLNPILDFYVIYKTPSGTLTAQELLLQYCVQSFEVRVTNGTPSITQTALWTNVSAPELGSLKLPNSDIEYGASRDTQLALTLALQTLLDGGALDMRILGTFENDVSTMDAMKNLGSNIATSISNSIRSRNTGNLPSLVAQTSYLGTKVLVRWEWLTLPVTVAVFSSILLISTLRMSSRSSLKAWKSSIWPIFFVIDDDIRARTTLTNSVTKTRKPVEDLLVKFQRGSDNKWTISAITKGLYESETT